MWMTAVRDREVTGHGVPAVAIATLYWPEGLVVSLQVCRVSGAESYHEA